MARKRIGKNPGPVRTLVIPKQLSLRSEGAHGQPLAKSRIHKFPKPSAVDDVVSDRFIFEVGGDRFAITWTAEIEQLPPARPVAVVRRLKSDQ